MPHDADRIMIHPLRRFCVIGCLFGLVFTAACRRDMHDQPKMKPLRSSTFFRDHLSARPLVEGTVPRGYLRADAEFFTGKKPMAQRATGTGQSAAAPALAPTAAGPKPTQATQRSAAAAGGQSATAAYPDDIETFPFQISEDTVKRGQERFQIFCSPCHGLTGYGDGIVVRRGFRRAASFHDDRLRQAPVGHFFDAITNGWGAMPSYGPQIPVQDRWAIIAYIRALQLSQQNQQQAQAQQAEKSPPRQSTGGGGPKR